ncbi:MAG: box helicase [Massilia sp.]|jgi:helicase|nr:box helicase [Massilia sp.]
MKASLAKWIGDSDALTHRKLFNVVQGTVELAHIDHHADDYYIALVGEFFDRMRANVAPGPEWARIGAALFQIAGHEQDNARIGIASAEALLFAATAFYCGGYSASAYLVSKRIELPDDTSEITRACLDLLTRPKYMTSRTGTALLQSLRRGRMDEILTIKKQASLDARGALAIGPDQWIPARLFEKLIERFAVTNIRAVLPAQAGHSDFWTPIVESMLVRPGGPWEFFPSQITAIGQGLFDHRQSFALQMPTGAGKTALSELLLYWQAQQSDTDVSILLVPYRSLASELRGSLVKHLNSMGIASRCAYGGTVPTGAEVGALSATRVVVATPESLLGLIGADAGFLGRVSLIICDEGHLLDGDARGVGLELLLARMRVRLGQPPRFVFISAIVPNIEEINAWLGGNASTVVKSDYRPALAEYATLRPQSPDAGRPYSVALEMHPHEVAPTKYAIDGFLSRSDFQYVDRKSGRSRTYQFKTIKTQAVGAARKALPMGGVAIFCANKGGNQGAFGVTDELLGQLQLNLNMPNPGSFADATKTSPVSIYLKAEFGNLWIGALAVDAGAVMHHGDVPQEAREILEELLRDGAIRLAICTSTLAEGVNLPIRTLILYSVRRTSLSGRPTDMLTRDIKNLVGRAGRPGSATKGLVICANSDQWPMVSKVALQNPGERVDGALFALINTVSAATAAGRHLTNAFLENDPTLYSLVDGIDATLIDLAAEEVGFDQLLAMASKVANQTFAAVQVDAPSKLILHKVFHLRAERIVGLRDSGRIAWVRETGARARLVDLVEQQLAPSNPEWDDASDRSMVVRRLLNWAWHQRELQEAVREAFKLGYGTDVNSVHGQFMVAVASWNAGDRYQQMAQLSGLAIDRLLAVHTKAISYVLQTLIEQAIALLSKMLETDDRTLDPWIAEYPERLRYGVPSEFGLTLAAHGVRHRFATIELARSMQRATPLPTGKRAILRYARDSLEHFPVEWAARLGDVVYQRTLVDLTGN